MDPDVAFAEMSDTGARMADRIDSAKYLRNWLLHGGFPPRGLSTPEALQMCVNIIEPSRNID